MRRLREQASSPDPLVARAAKLLLSVPSLELEGSARYTPAPVEVRSTRSFLGVRPMVAIAVTLGSVAAAAATLDRAGWRPASLRVSSVTSNPLSAPGRSGLDRGAGATSPDVGVDALRPSLLDRVEAAPPSEPTFVPRSAAPTSRFRAMSSGSGRGDAKGASRASAPAASAEDESALVVASVRALRREGDPVRAQTLAEEALTRFPHGVQREEAMAVAMEAALARGDVPSARKAAERYLLSFENGRFADRASRILAAPSR